MCVREEQFPPHKRMKDYGDGEEYSPIKPYDMNLFTDERARTVTETDVSFDLITSKNGPKVRKKRVTNT